MKLKNILISGLGVLALTSCGDYLDVDAPSSYTTGITFGSTEAVEKALNGVYAKILDGNTFGNYLYSDLMLNSDVDFVSNANSVAQIDAPRRFDCKAESGHAEKLWNALYSTIEVANEFIDNTEASAIYTSEDSAQLQQFVGEAKVIRAMAYSELVWYYGDVPFTMKGTFHDGILVPAIESRDVILKTVIDDLKGIAEKMNNDKTIEHITQDAAYAMIARLALQAGGYSLRHSEDASSYGFMARPTNYQEFYQTAREYAKKVIDGNRHSLSKSFQDVFIDECNFVLNEGDDAIFEIPFAREASGNVGYSQGPAVSTSDGVAPFAWGGCNGGVRTSAFLRYQYDEKDVRRDYVCGLWNYASTGVPNMNLSYANHNNKWSKLWSSTTFGADKTGSTGINFPYLRYADVLLMFAEADNELNGPSEEAFAALKQVHNRAFSNGGGDKVEWFANAMNGKADFLNAVLTERKYEFAGENLRWKDLVRNNQYGEKLFYTFLLYYSAASTAGGASDDYYDLLLDYDGIDYQNTLPFEVYSCAAGTGSKNLELSYFPNNSIPKRFVLNPFTPAMQPTVNPSKHEASKPYYVSEKSLGGSTEDVWTVTEPFSWWDDELGIPKDQVLYSLYGFIQADTRGIKVIRDGREEYINPTAVANNISSLPVVRYLLPIPAESVARSSGAYKNYYGY